jgi:cyclase
MPCLLLKDKKLVKTIQFQNENYIGDPVNAIKIYNEKEVDELILLDITSTVNGTKPPFNIIAEISDECTMPLTYGGGIQNIDDAKKILNLGAEKISINSYSIQNPAFNKELASLYGNQSIVASIDARKVGNEYHVYSHRGTKDAGINPREWAERLEKSGAGEILLNSIDRDGMMMGYDLELISLVSKSVSVPVIALGGAGRIEDFREAIDAGASACAAGSMFVYQGRRRSVLINFPSREELVNVFTGLKGT